MMVCGFAKAGVDEGSEIFMLALFGASSGNEEQSCTGRSDDEERGRETIGFRGHASCDERGV